MKFKVFAPGGLFPPNDLKRLVNTLRAVDIQTLGVGERQDWTASISDSRSEEAVRCLNQTGLFWARTEVEAHNVVSSASAVGLAPATSWLVADTFREALEGFAVSPRLRVGVTDPLQGLVPRYVHDLNFTAAERPDSWRLDLRLAGTRGEHLFPWPVLFGTRELARAAFLLEDEIVAYENRSSSALVEALAKRFPANRPLDRQRPALTFPRLPVHEGMNRLTSQNLSLGLWRRSESFPLDFLDDLASLCQTTGVGFLGLTPWKSLFLPGVRDKDRGLWEDLLNRHGVNTRHAAQELGWIVGDEPGLRLKKQKIARSLVNRDVRTFGLTFSLAASRPSTSVAIERSGPSFWPFWNILRSESPGAEGLSYKIWKKNLPDWSLAKELEAVCRSFSPTSPAPWVSMKIPSLIPTCPDCRTSYDEEWGDPLGGVAAGTPFADLPAGWACPVCGTPAVQFAKLDRNLLPNGNL